MKEGMPSRLMKPAGDGEGTVGGGAEAGFENEFEERVKRSAQVIVERLAPKQTEIERLLEKVAKGKMTRMQLVDAILEEVKLNIEKSVVGDVEDQLKRYKERADTAPGVAGE
ncbi:hypothetical protein A3A95_01435 [Candidatus Nomurabacteria bacterium RIFCSPLOWO2_01_FULL_39_18]|uniref:Uncharacterized protein n=1 Tax=Candidatus Nomurabacteria bacterium RIFCSPHIGHO2_01_FULL_40_24b TaxID=1801739 RepID=A0A1F6V7X3_9BACT|nr:MAG: hypothetical protein A2647_00255 [Candidatus Nomurabacteria bacterium RIFCSPHIGHO2_01_FULL_40_24b]OGI88952.1 MAG: hypothetical protein A3A95_01435 [Candidatus Nomurabacteria bacterium RIFCSPLOWO2_01_FULL_39_18]